MDVMVKDLLEEAVERFNKMAEDDPKVKEEAGDKVRRVQILLDEGNAYNMTLDHGHIDGVHDGPLVGAEITVETDAATLRGIMEGEINAMKAYATKKIRLKASLTDLLTLRKLFF
jgi:putative sterol carrier protein